MARWQTKPRWTRQECLARLDELEADIKMILERPQQVSASGVSTTYGARYEQLVAERKVWRDRLEAATQWQQSGQRSSGAQGPEVELK